MVFDPDPRREVVYPHSNSNALIMLEPENMFERKNPFDIMSSSFSVEFSWILFTILFTVAFLRSIISTLLWRLSGRCFMVTPFARMRSQ